MIAIEYEQVSKQFSKNAKPSVDRVSAQIEEGEFITILGSSGCGKTTLLKMTNRLLDPSGGRIILFGEDISTVDPVTVRRRMGYVIQQIGLLPHMTVEENITILPKLMKQDRETVRSRARQLLSMVQLDPDTYAARYPSELSGGQQQRVGLARALMPDPKIMLLDEPFGAIDAITRISLQNELLRIHRETKKTFLLVTHDINEAMKLGNRVMIMNEGRLLQFDTPREIIRHPADPFVEALMRSAYEQQSFWEGVRDD